MLCTDADIAKNVFFKKENHAVGIFAIYGILLFLGTIFKREFRFS